MKKREYGLDLLKVFACLGVVSLHTLLRGSGALNMLIARLSVTAVPLFIMVSGYLMMCHPNMDYRYALRKVGRILLVCFCWEFLHAVAHFVVYREIRPFVQSFVLDFFQKGLFYHFWYMGALILLYLLMPLANCLFKYSVRVYRYILLFLCVANSALNLSILMSGYDFLSAIPQSLHIWFWLEYALLGGLLARDQDARAWICARVTPVRMILAMVLMVAGIQLLKGIRGEMSYGFLPIQLASVAIFAGALKIRFGKNAQKLLWVSSLTMGIYIMHPFVLAVLNKFVPAFTQGGAVMNLAFWLLTTAVCAVGTMIVQKIPGMNQLLKL